MIETIEIDSNFAIQVNDANDLERVLLNANGLNSVKNEIERLARNYIADPTTAKGRKELEKHCAKVKKSIKIIDDLRLEVVAELKDKPKRIDKNVNVVKDYLRNVYNELLAPVILMEEREKQIELIGTLPATMHQSTAQELNARIAFIDSINVDNSWHDYGDEARKVLEATKTGLLVLLEKRIQHDKNMEELAVLRREKEEHERLNKSTITAPPPPAKNELREAKLRTYMAMLNYCSETFATAFMQDVQAGKIPHLTWKA